MKTRLAIIIGCLAIACSASSFGWWSKWDSCHDENISDDSYCSTCQCTDEGYGRNDCMSLGKYCEVYGNVGGR